MSSGNNKGMWASDEDANDLLAGILDETEEDARSEEEKIQAELEAREQEARRKEQEELERKRAEAKARITAEEERLEGLEKRRTMRQEALRIEELKERGEYVEDEPEQDEGPSPAEEASRRERELEDARRREQEQRHQRELAEARAARQATAAPERSNAIPMLALAATIALVIGTGIGAFALTQGSYEPDTSVYSKSVYEPREPQDLQVSVGFTPIEEKPVVEESDQPAPAVRPEAPSTPRPTASADPDTTSSDDDDDSSAPSLPDFDDSEFDPFGEGP